jgi:hypothetical protein
MTDDEFQVPDELVAEIAQIGEELEQEVDHDRVLELVEAGINEALADARGERGAPPRLDRLARLQLALTQPGSLSVTYPRDRYTTSDKILVTLTVDDVDVAVCTIDKFAALPPGD